MVLRFRAGNVNPGEPEAPVYSTLARVDAGVFCMGDSSRVDGILKRMNQILAPPVLATDGEKNILARQLHWIGFSDPGEHYPAHSCIPSDRAPVAGPLGSDPTRLSVGHRHSGVYSPRSSTTGRWIAPGRRMASFGLFCGSEWRSECSRFRTGRGIHAA